MIIRKIFRNNSKVTYGFFCNQRGVVSLFLCLLLAALIPVIFTVITAVRFSAMKVQVECVSDMAMDSVLAEYNQVLLQRYNLLFVDMAYSEDYGSPDNTAGHLLNYMEYNLGPTDEILNYGTSDLFGLTVDSVDITRVSRATDNGGEVFRYMAISYMLEHYGYSYVESADDMITQAVSANLMDRDINEDLTSGRTELENIDYDSEEDSGSDYEEITIDDPTLSMNEITGDGILSLVYKGDVSETATDISICVSKRNLVTGDGVDPSWND